MKRLFFYSITFLFLVIAILASKAKIPCFWGCVSDSFCCGAARYGNKTLESLTTNGSLQLDGTHILGEATINGSLEALGATIGKLSVNGSVQLDGCRIKQGAMVNGALVCNESTIEGELSIATKKVALGRSTVSAITVRPSDGYEGTQVVELRDAQVNGPVVFKTGKGEVWLFGDSNVAGQVQGGIIHRK